jgi:hypothetical protein
MYILFTVMDILFTVIRWLVRLAFAGLGCLGYIGAFESFFTYYAYYDGTILLMVAMLFSYMSAALFDIIGD